MFFGTGIASLRGKFKKKEVLKMKGFVAVVLAVAVLVVAGSEAFAFGPGGMMGGGPRGFNPNYGYIAIDPATAARCLSFEETVLPLKRRLLDLKIEMLTLQAQPTPDTNAINAKFAEIYSVKSQIKQTAINQQVKGLCGGKGRKF